jgi:hypothetical protein
MESGNYCNYHMSTCALIDHFGWLRGRVIEHSGIILESLDDSGYCWLF